MGEVRKMPVYEYKCLKCDEIFSITERISEHGSKTVRCPHCKATTVERVFGGFFTKTSKKS